MHHDSFLLDRVEHSKWKPGHKDATKRPELHWACLRMSSDTRNSRIDAPDEI
jgi:hypothetical protein